MEGVKDNKWTPEEADTIRIYRCESCGGQIITDDTTGATKCPFCGNNVLIKGKFSGDLRPDYIIPFKQDKEQVKKAYLKHIEEKPFIPDTFKNKVDDICGIYVPFWSYDAHVYGKLRYRGAYIEDKDSPCTNYRNYDVFREGTFDFENVPADGSKIMDNDIMEGVEPFYFDEAVEFDPGYLAGFLAKRYDVTKQERDEYIKERMEECVKEKFRGTIFGYDLTEIRDSIIEITDIQSHYILLPVWIMQTSWKEKNYLFAMNGQTGKIVGNFPVDYKKVHRIVRKETLKKSLKLLPVLLILLISGGDKISMIGMMLFLVPVIWGITSLSIEKEAREMASLIPRKSARNYVKKGGFIITDQRDEYIGKDRSS